MNGKNGRPAAVIIAGLLVVATAQLTSGDATTRAAIAIAPGSTVWMEGKSTVHDWESRTSTVNVTFTRGAGLADPADPAAIEALVRANGVQGMEVEIPVAKLRSGKDGLDKNMMKTLRAEKYPAIRFHMDRYTATGAAGDTLSLRAEGDLEVAGKKKDVTLEARAWKGDKGMWVSGTEPLDMTSFEIKPPTMMMGAIKTSDRVVIHYRLLLAPGANRPAAGQTEK